jgi:hypothetical protein
MHTCFWAGDTFAPQLLIKANDGAKLPVQQYLQDAFLDMWEKVIETLADLEAIAGFQACLFCM